MKKLQYVCISAIACCFVATAAVAESIESNVQNIYSKGTSYLRLVVNEKDFESCTLKNLAETEVEFARDLLIQCGLRVKSDEVLGKRTVYVYNKNEIASTTDHIYVKYNGNLLEYVRKYFKDWELRGSGVNDVYLIDGWRPLSIEALYKEIAASWLVDLNYADQRIYVYDKKIDKSGDLRFGIFLPFDDRNQDIYELAKGYLTTLSLVKYSRDGKEYMLVSDAEETREALSKTYSFIKASLRQRWLRAVRLGAYFPEAERNKLKLLYLLVNSSEIKGFVGNELEGIPLHTLVSLGFDKYNDEIAKVESQDLEKMQSTKLPDYLPNDKTTETTVQQAPRQREMPTGPVIERMDPTTQRSSSKLRDERLQHKLDALKQQQ